MRFTRIAGLLLGLALSATQPAWAHPGHETYAEVVRNDRSRSLEVSLRIRTTDLESALSRRGEQRVDLLRSSDLESLLQEYVGRHFRVRTAAGERLQPRFAGHELDPREVWVYFEFRWQPEASVNTFRLENTLLLSEQEHHVNFVELRHGSSVRMLRFDASRRSRTLGHVDPQDDRGVPKAVERRSAPKPRSWTSVLLRLVGFSSTSGP